MNFEEYKKVATSRLNETIANNEHEKIDYICIGIGEETGEILGEIRKATFKNYHQKSLDKNAIKKELGDLIWYLALACEVTQIDMNKFKIDVSNYKNIPALTLTKDRREKLKKFALQIGTCSGEIMENIACFETSETELEKKNILELIQNQIENICKTANELGIKFDEILEANIEKIQLRYHKNGKIKKDGEVSIDEECK